MAAAGPVLPAFTAPRSPAALKSEMGPAAADIAQVIAEVRDRLPDLPPPKLEPEQALATAQDCSMAGLEEKVKSLQTSRQYSVVSSEHEEGAALPTQTAAAGPRPPDALFRCDGDYWTIGYQGATCRLKDCRGLHYLALLLRHPHREFHAVELATRVTGAAGEPGPGAWVPDQAEREPRAVGCGEAGALLDPQARAAYKRRVQDLRAELDEARSFPDPGRAERAQEELEFLTRELARAVGLGGRQRLAACAAERARTNITHAIKAALRKLSAHHPLLGQHLTLTIKTGAFCSYTPDPCLPLSWQV